MQNGDLINPVAELALNAGYNNKRIRFFGNGMGKLGNSERAYIPYVVWC